MLIFLVNSAILSTACFPKIDCIKTWNIDEVNHEYQEKTTGNGTIK
jgi:hypothetical protein